MRRDDRKGGEHQPDGRTMRVFTQNETDYYNKIDYYFDRYPDFHKYVSKIIDHMKRSPLHGTDTPTVVLLDEAVVNVCPWTVQQPPIVSEDVVNDWEG